MPLLTTPRKNRVTLNDYPYEKDIKNRLFLSQLSDLEVVILQEILNHSLKIPLEQFAKELECSVNELLPAIDKLSMSGLFKRTAMNIEVDKEMRKFFEFQVQKFDPEFKPDLEHISNALNLLPIQILPNWYAIPRSSDHIFSSIVEKYFQTPKLYRQYLQELSFEDPILQGILTDLLQFFPQPVTAGFLKDKYAIDPETFEEYLLLLEYHFVCCLVYQELDGEWQELIKPLVEWADYLTFENEKRFQKIVGLVKPDQPREYHFLRDCMRLLKSLEDGPQSESPSEPLINKLLQVKLIQKDEKITLTAKGKRWLAKSEAQFLRDLSKDPLNVLSQHSQFEHLWNMRNLKLIERSLNHLQVGEWVDFDHYFDSFIEPLGNREPVSLIKRGRKWKYAFPVYQSDEKEFVRAVLQERLVELGIIATGAYQGKMCFCVTDFGAPFVSPV